MPTAIDSNSKPDTVLLLDAIAADPWIDYSQYRDSLADQGSYVDESPSPRTAIDAPREIALVWDVQPGETGVLLEHGGAGGHGYRVRIAAGGVVECHENGSLRVSATIPGLVSGVDRKILIHWSQHPDGTNVRSELALYNFTSAIWVHTQATHAAGTTNAKDTLTVGAAYGGGSAFSGGLDFHKIRIGRRFHSTTEAKEDWVAPRAPPTTTQTRRTAPLVPDRDTLLDLARDGAFVGPAHLWSGHSFEQSDRRLIGPLVNVRPLDPLAITHNYNTPNTAWWRTAPGDESVHLCIALLWCRPVPNKVNRAHVRLFVRQQNSSNSPGDTAAAEVRYRMYSLAGLPVVNEPVGPLSYHRTAQATCSIDHVTGPGQWLDLGELPLAVDSLGHTWLAVGVSMDEGSAYAASTTAYVFAVTVDPFFEPAGDGGLDLVEP